jgi:hypothetical protein
MKSKIQMKVMKSNIAALLDNRYSLKKPWVDIWGNFVGGKFNLSLDSLIAEMDSEF